MAKRWAFYGIGQGIYLNWPILGPSSPRDTIGTIGDFFLYPYPSTDVSAWPVWLGVKVHDKVNDTSFKIGDYEALTQAAIDPYVAIRDAYTQYRQSLIKSKGVRSVMQEEPGAKKIK